MDHDRSLPASKLYPQAKYVRELRSVLPAGAFVPAYSRMLFVPVHVAIAVVSALAIARGWVPWFVVPVLSLVIGASFACLSFVAHEALHGGMVRGKRLRHIIGWIGFSPVGVSPRLWVAWHDRVHHANANLPDDPDMYPTLETYRGNRTVRFFVDAFSLGGKRWRGGLSLLLGFTVQSVNQLLMANKRGFLSRSEHRRAIAESVLALAMWTTVAILVGPLAFVFVFVIPHLITNIVIMSFILTNHSLSPRIAINDPLVSGLSVTTTPLIDWVTLRFGYHVEHHLFPAMSSRHAHHVRDLLRERWPGRYQSMPLWSAMAALHRTARVYKDDTTLIDPRTGHEFPTLMPRDIAA